MDTKQHIIDFHLGKCDKCGKIVPKENSAVLVQEIATKGFAGFVMNRHLFPTDNCEGSPSRICLVETDPAWADAHRKVILNKEETDA